MNDTMPSLWMIAIPLIGLIVVVVTHLFIMARWSGKVDANLTQIMAQPAQWTTDLNAATAALRLEMTGVKLELNARIDSANAEIKILREARHDSDGKIAQHDGALREIGRRLDIHAERS